MPNGDWVHEEIQRLRDWRHDVVSPALVQSGDHERRLRLLERQRRREKKARRSNLRFMFEAALTACAVVALVLSIIHY